MNNWVCICYTCMQWGGRPDTVPAAV